MEGIRVGVKRMWLATASEIAEARRRIGSEVDEDVSEVVG